MKEKHLLSTNLPVAYLIKLHCYTDKDSLSNIMAHSHIARKWKSQNLKTDLIFLPRCTHARQAVKREEGRRLTQGEAWNLIIYDENFS